MRVHLVDGTYELFRQYLAPRPGHLDPDGVEVGATRAVVSSMLTMLEDGATHLGVATDHVIESFRNDLWETYKDGSRHRPAAARTSSRCSRTRCVALGVTVWPMVEFEADDALGARGGGRGGRRPGRAGDHLHARQGHRASASAARSCSSTAAATSLLDAEGVREKFGVPPESIPDWLALVGDTADGFPGLPGFGAKTAAALLARFGHIEAIPDDPTAWDVPGVRGAERLAATLAAGPRGRGAVQGARDAAARRARRQPSTTGSGADRAADLGDWCERFGSPRLVDARRQARGAERTRVSHE